MISNEEIYKQLLEEYLRRRNDSEFDLLWDQFDEKVKQTLGIVAPATRHHERGGG